MTGEGGLVFLSRWHTDMNPADGPFAETLKGLMALKRYGRGDEIAGLVSYQIGRASCRERV